MKKQIQVIGPKDRKNFKNYINTTSSGTEFKGLSPFFLGPINLYGMYIAQNVENAWQFSKVYKQYVDKYGMPTEEYFNWAIKGWNDKFAHRYPLGKNVKPLYSLWNGQQLNYIQARKQIYIPLYSVSVQKTEEWQNLLDLIRKGNEIVLFDYDGYSDYNSIEEVENNPNKKMGHAFVLAKILGPYCE